ncbi:hypothetical protein [Flavobacterium cerinum]|uniref:DUF1735 domain-containing protein n=1 Tax=Flavobacterium cerinum TaxID=2502784 RepID=A0ABY5IS28_9FLAO|nr:hypothetical protein [Flavobacterium cerinum]UUC45661.1 hypothetical protein NOX80_00260 [Flavobacterium cerinum]
MKKNKRYLNSAFALLLSGLAFVSCNDNEVDYVFNEKPAITTDLSAYTVNEGDELSIVLTTSKVSNVPMEIKLEVLGNSTAVLDEDFELPGELIGPEQGLGNEGYMIAFPANVSTYTVKIPITLDDEFEQDELIALKISGTHNMNGTIDKVVNITIKNKAKDELDLTLGWDKSFAVGGTNYTLCGLDYDVDILVFDAVTFDPVGDGAQTGDCPEHLVMPLADYPNGTYLLVGYLYDDAGVPGAGLPEFNIPITIDYFRGGSQTLTPGSYTQTTGFLTSNSQGENSAGAGGGAMTIIAKVEVNNGVFKLMQPNDAVIAQGKASILNKINTMKKGKPFSKRK